MITKKMYRYLGRNGTFTTQIKLENIAPIDMIYLEAEAGNILTDGYKKVYSTVVFADELENWREVEDKKGQE